MVRGIRRFSNAHRAGGAHATAVFPQSAGQMAPIGHLVDCCFRAFYPICPIHESFRFHTPSTGVFRLEALIVTGYVFTAELANAMRGDTLQHPCPVCRKISHEPDAAFCSRCGNALFKKLE